MSLPETKEKENEIDSEFKKINEKQSESNSKELKKHQKKASEKMKEMSQMMQKAMMENEEELNEENIESLKLLLENLIQFSFDEESLMKGFESIDVKHPSFGDKLKKQHVLKEYFEHIDDSLFALSMRLPKLSVKIQEHLSNAHYNLDLSLDNFSENKFYNGASNQQYVVTEANNLVDMLSEILDNMQNNSSPKSGKGKGGKKGPSFSLPDIIKKQKSLLEKMKGGDKKGKKPGNKSGQKPGAKGEKGKSSKSGGKGEGDKKGSEGLNGELYKIFQEQNQLRNALEEAMKNGKIPGSRGRNVLKKMEDLENEILEKGFNRSTFNKMQDLQYNLLKLQEAQQKQGEENKRESQSNNATYKKESIKELEIKKLFYNQREILNRQSLPLQQNYKDKVQEYFKAQ